VNTTSEPEADLRLQASSPAQGYLSEGGAQGVANKRSAQASARGGQIAKERERAQSGQVKNNKNKRMGKTVKKSGHPSDDGTSATNNEGGPITQFVDGQATGWLKSLLPEPQSGWWEVNVKGKGFAVKFRWRDAARQTLLFPQITGAQFIALKQSGSEEAARILRERISANLQSFLLDPTKRDKALIVARKLGTNLLASRSLIGAQSTSRCGSD
jgi:hypothetical protein